MTIGVIWGLIIVTGMWLTMVWYWHDTGPGTKLFFTIILIAVWWGLVFV
tara:strand:- start:335 stop:481 length:147 start_codon:yes stop_codon:yes gene_type:complete